MPVEVGDTELRAGLSDVRSLIAELPARGRRLLHVAAAADRSGSATRFAWWLRGRAEVCT